MNKQHQNPMDWSHQAELENDRQYNREPEHLYLTREEARARYNEFAENWKPLETKLPINVPQTPPSMKEWLYRNNVHLLGDISNLELKTLGGRKVRIFESYSRNGIGGAHIETIGYVNAGSILFAKGQTIIERLENASQEFRNRIDPEYSYDFIEFTLPFFANAILDRDSTEKLKIFRQEQHEKRVAEARANCEARIKAEEEKFPGITLLREAYEQECEYREAFNRMMDDEYNDGVRSPKAPTLNYDKLAEEYPRAALYLKAEGYTFAANYAKVSAGEKAMQMLKCGHSLDEVQAVLNNWTAGCYID